MINDDLIDLIDLIDDCVLAYYLFFVEELLANKQHAVISNKPFSGFSNTNSFTRL
ncbi:hypothetical protein FLAVO9R_130044 [Flavobacterium sp. 9R]|nr:hypothetical protein FLAVO9R_130044 [Flavobacterium sp. 9R]